MPKKKEAKKGTKGDQKEPKVAKGTKKTTTKRRDSFGTIKIKTAKNIPKSPYVISLKRNEPIKRAVDKTIHPDVLRLIMNDRNSIEDLLVTEKDVMGQIMENDFTPIHVSSVKKFHPISLSASSHKKTEPLTEAIPIPQLPFVSEPVHEVLGNIYADAAEHVYLEMNLPEPEEAPEQEEADLVEFKEYRISNIERRDNKQTAKRSTFQIRNSKFQLKKGWHKAMAGFIALSFTFVLPLHAMKQVEKAKINKLQIESTSKSALSNISLGATALSNNSYNLAQGDFERASANFENAEAKIKEISISIQTALNAIPETADTYNTLTSLISAGAKLSKAAALFSSSLSEMRHTTDNSPVVKLDILTSYLERIEPLLVKANDSLSDIDVSSLPKEYRESVLDIKNGVPELEGSVQEFLTFNDILRTVMGAEKSMKYLVLFQNNTEIRPSGGFIGSFAEITINNGKIVDINIPDGGSYDLQGSLSEFVYAPEPLQLINARWEFQDANWFADFPTTAKKLIWFYDKSGGPTVDGVLAVNATFVANLIALLGPFDMKEYDQTINGENFIFEAQKIVEMEYDPKENKPKKFIGDLAPLLLEATVNADTLTFLKLLQSVGDGFNTKDSQLFLSDTELMKKIDDLGWSGKIKQTTGDYLMVVDANLGGGKTDLVINQTVDLHVDIGEDGSIINTVTITREHRGLKNELFTGVNNVDYQRVYVPRGSELISAKGDFAKPDKSLFETYDLPLQKDSDLSLITGKVTVDPKSGTEINEEFGKTVFGNWIQTKPGSSSVISYTYKLPFSLSAVVEHDNLIKKLKKIVGLVNSEKYSLLVQKQSGIMDRETHVSIDYATKLKPLWVSDESLIKNEALLNNQEDTFIAVLFE